MRCRMCCIILLLTAAVSMKSVQTASAEIVCDLNVYYAFPPDQSKPWYTISASKTFPEKPVVKQQLEELAARGALSQPPNKYYAQFTASVSLEPGTAKWNTIEKRDVWKWDCTPEMEKQGQCRVWGHWEKVDACVAHGDNPSQPVYVYRSIQTMKVFLIPTDKTQLWYKHWELSPTMMLAYPDFWMQVAIGEGGGLSADYPGILGGPHFLYSDPIRGEYFLPTKLPTRFTALALINPDDARNFSEDIVRVIPVCDVNEGNGVSDIVYEYGYEDKYNLNSDIDADPYTCTIGTTVVDNKTQSIILDITDYDFDIPGTFYIGVATQISPAISPVDKNQTEPVTDPKYFQPSNIILPLSDPASYGNTKFTVWMIVSTPCWSGDGGCDTEKNP